MRGVCSPSENAFFCAQEPCGLGFALSGCAALAAAQALRPCAVLWSEEDTAWNWYNAR
jgi:pantoate kinase